VTHGDLVAELSLLYRAAGRPSFRKISNEIRERDDMPDTVSHETVNALLGGTFIPRWSKVECVVRQLSAMAVHRPDPDAEVQRFLELWAAANDARNETSAPVLPEGGEPAAHDPTLDAPPPGTSLGGPPTVEPQTGSAPPPNPGFTGRADVLNAMTAKLNGEPWQPLILHGISGVGKTSIAVEFVHRVRAEFDVVWWIVAEQVSQARSALVALGARRDLPISQDMGQTVRSMLGRLESADFKWLIVFDNAAGPEEIGPLLPAAGGAVIVTTRNADWLEHGRAINVDVLPRADSVRLLQSSSDVSFDEADQLAGHLGDLPLALEQAAAMRSATKISVSDYLRLLGRQATLVLNQGRPRDYPETVASAFAVTFNQVKRESAGTAQLLAMLSCLSAEPISLTLLRAADDGDIRPPLRPDQRAGRGRAHPGAPARATHRPRLAHPRRARPGVRERAPPVGGHQPGPAGQDLDLGDARADRTTHRAGPSGRGERARHPPRGARPDPLPVSHRRPRGKPAPE
jgi:hypothetical protein